METNAIRESYKRMVEAKKYKTVRDAVTDNINNYTPIVAGNSGFSKDDDFGISVDVISDPTATIPLVFIFDVIIRGISDRIDVIKAGSKEYDHIMKSNKNTSNLQDYAKTYYDMIK